MPLSSSLLLDLSLGAIMMLAVVSSYINFKLKFLNVLYLSSLLCIVLSLELCWIYRVDKIPAIFFPTICLIVPVFKAHIHFFNPNKNRKLWAYLPSILFYIILISNTKEFWLLLTYAAIGLYMAISGLQSLIQPERFLEIKLKHLFTVGSISVSFIGFIILIHMLKIGTAPFRLQIQIQHIVWIFYILLILNACLYFLGMIHAMIKTEDVIHQAVLKQKTLKTQSIKKTGIQLLAMEEYVERLNVLMQQQIYLNQELSLAELAQKIKIPPHQLSLILKEALGINFYGYINQYRIKHALMLIEKEACYQGIENLAYSCGFNNRASFNRYFKSITGLTPSAYLEQLLNSKK